MTDPENVSGDPEQNQIRFTDKRRFDPETFQRRQPADGTPTDAAADQAAAEAGTPEEANAAEEAETVEGEVSEGQAPQTGTPGTGAPEAGAPETGAPEGDVGVEVPDDASALVDDERVVELEGQVKGLTEDLQRLQAEYVNYKRRVDRDRDLAKQGGIESVMRDMLEVLDDLAAARAHEDLTGGFKAVADEIEKICAKHGLQAYGEVGEAFDPQLHDALMQQEAPEGMEVDGPTIVTILQQGYLIDGRVLRPARVAVAGS